MQDKVTILVIDDDITIRTLLNSTLSNKGFNVKSTSRGAEGLKIARSELVDVILLDWLMPEMDGMEVLTELKRDSKTMYIPVVMLTCKEDSKDIDLAITKGAVDYIVKPFNAFQIPDMVQKHLEKINGKSGKKGFISKLFS
ncbi:MAG: Alkaline phosphatase synthesis transcriptional regulatory protein PhoP [Planctomycetes bacterium ADurb.Bin401]|nr:MAG: Alkaline phosphatase synthesis transcriptional regulatory protein PhoP [Planctomycetes bacterium ADurb.Bin401]